jgi:hypothetical protein
MNKPPKLTRAQIREGLEAMPLDTLLLGAQAAKQSALTPKQREFARQLAMGETKAGAYRAAYKSKGKPKVQHQEGAKLASNPRISMYAEALNQAMEAQRLQTPHQLRALVVHQLTAHAINEDLKPTERLRALELLGKVTEVAAFTERREVIKTTDSSTAREVLLQSIMTAIKENATDATDTTADSLLDEIKRAANQSGTIDAETIEVKGQPERSEDQAAQGEEDNQNADPLPPDDIQQAGPHPTPTP